MTDGAAAIRVLVADDNDEERELIVGMLEGLGYLVVAVASGREAVDVALAEQTRPDAMLLDVNMPNGSGIDAAKEIATQLPQTAVVLFTGDETLTLSTEEWDESSAITILNKPARRGTLDGAIRLAIKQRREKERLKTQLEERKVIERAKGALMQRRHCSEQEAYASLRRMSQDRSLKMIEVATRVLRGDPGFA